MRKYIDHELTLLNEIAPGFAMQIYAEIKSEANIYGTETEYERLMRVNRLLLRGIEPDVVLEFVRQQKDGLIDLIIRNQMSRK